MKNKKIVRLKAFLFAILTTFIIYIMFKVFLNKIALLSDEEILLLISNHKIISTIIFLFFFYGSYLGCINDNQIKQIFILRSVELNSYIPKTQLPKKTYFSDEVDKYIEILNKISDDEWKAICQKYDELVDKARKAEKAKKQQILNEHDAEIQEKINKIKGNLKSNLDIGGQNEKI